MLLGLGRQWGGRSVLLVSDVPHGRWVGGAEARITGLPDPGAQAEGPASQGGQADAAAGAGRCFEAPTGPCYVVSEPWSPSVWKERGLKARVC